MRWSITHAGINTCIASNSLCVRRVSAVSISPPICVSTSLFLIHTLTHICTYPRTPNTRTQTHTHTHTCRHTDRGNTQDLSFSALIRTMEPRTSCRVETNGRKGHEQQGLTHNSTDEHVRPSPLTANGKCVGDETIERLHVPRHVCNASPDPSLYTHHNML
jgi:hypothetical protein